MICPTITTTIYASGWPAASKRDLSKAHKEALQDAIIWWATGRLPAHFKAGARERYGYAKRSATYQRRKIRRKGHNRDLVYSGASEAATRTIKISGTSGRARAVAPLLPRYFYMLTPKGLDKMKELGTLTPDEQTKLATVYRDRTIHHLQGITRTKKITA